VEVWCVPSCYPCAVYIPDTKVRMMVFLTQCVLPYFGESPFVPDIYVYTSLLQADILQKIFNVNFTSQACE
jgi:hypothetical protein